MSVEGITMVATIASILSSLAAAGSTAYTLSQAGKHGPVPTLPKTPTGDMAALGLMKSERMGGATPQWTQGLTGGGSTAPLPGAGGAAATNIGGTADEAANVFSKYLSGG